MAAREQTTVRLPGDLLAIARDHAEEADLSFTSLLEEALRAQLGVSPQAATYQLGQLVDRVDRLERLPARVERLETLAEQEGAI